MQPQHLSQEYWDERYRGHNIPWDAGAATPPMQTIGRSLQREEHILIPGAGNAYEAVFLAENGFKHITVLDISPEVIATARKRLSNFPQVQIYCEDFFIHTGSYDVVLEQTFFCALHPSLRTAYVAKMHELLQKNGILTGVLFDREFEEGPPFGASRETYLDLFRPMFTVEKLEPCTNSIKPRAGTELFFRFRKQTLT